MADVQTVWNTQTGQGDWVLVNGALQAGDDLGTAALISLFTDRLADASDPLPAGSTDRRGWWGDSGQDYPIGSRLWLLARAKQLPATLQQATAYCNEALQWMVADQVVASFQVVCSFPGPALLGIAIVFYNAAGGVMAQYNWAWAGLN